MYLLFEIPLFLLVTLYSYLEAFVKLFIPAKKKSISGELVLITGSGHGLGRATAYEFAKRQCNLVLWDINKHGVEETAEECKRLGATAHAFVVDCSKKEDIYKTAEKVKEEIGDVSILMNNAGVVSPTDVMSTDDRDIQKTFEVNILAHYWTTKAFVPTMMRNNHGHVVTVASAGGHTVAPFLVAYCSSKFAAVGFHRALTAELAALGKHGVKTSCVCPMFINSDFVKNPSSRLMPPMEPEDVAKQVMKGVLTNERMIFIPPFLKFTLMLDRLLPDRAVAFLWKLINLKFDHVVTYKDAEN
ncbi:estradiol 17-beta-dehydrogenase 11 [Anolis carolinensis]|uniref:Estradiol 17-beta-dehydrogenase 11 n=1 Tax=Anolis carolinensis TaxID=28377 RepID=A0A803SY83_ANOCA|nr:PREDICTED: estradiol 17-beta-dehydrogenase 11 [Anolis carolinensis]|eukprot:XP_003221338.1 PREDICTED: estradiol 17-beta-dehydrogenase 11 [Anolis carolinensis]